MTYFNFQFKKIIKNKFNWIVAIILTFSIGICFFFNNNNAHTYSYENDAVRQVQQTKSNISKIKQGNNEDSQHQKIDKVNLKEQNETLKSNENRLEYIRSGNYQKAYDIDIAQTEKDFIINRDSPGGSSSPELGSAIRRDNLRFHYLKNHRIQKESDYYPNKSNTFMTWTLQNIIPIIFTVCIIFLLSQIYTDPFIDKINILNLLPIKRNSRYLKDLSFGLDITYGTLVLSLAFAFILSGIFGGNASLNYPFLSWISTGNMFFQSTFTVFIKGLVLTILSLFFLVQIVYLLSYLIRNRFATLFVNLIIICGLIGGVTIIEPLQKMAKFLPTTYFNSVGVVSGQFSNQISNYSVTYQSGIICLLISVIVTYLLTLLVINYVKKY